MIEIKIFSYGAIGKSVVLCVNHNLDNWNSILKRLRSNSAFVSTNVQNIVCHFRPNKKCFLKSNFLPLSKLLLVKYTLLNLSCDLRRVSIKFGAKKRLENKNIVG